MAQDMSIIEGVELAHGRDQTLYAYCSQTDLGQALGDMAQTLRAMADMIRATNERMSALEHQVRLMEKVTPGQARAINEAIQARGRELCQSYRAPGQEKGAANAIRKEIRLTAGVTSMKELPRCDYALVMKQIQMWDDYKQMKALRAKGGTKA